ncbi:PP2C family protein-serine/threonine phosphatase [Amycolatopsis australiensis]|uniref:GAF domain-containing protein n=1 Tax=Amycolatopsis australiensis TaxID=546364 RepID=A0A1K1SSQ1_9PSEU|nr:GAF domain-containing SpoIIE family protein phosphatase [Amycolatopsis australiensis]SFW87432.1 GAF domain-containing protein [Amycolatopsis australiensis]
MTAPEFDELLDAVRRAFGSGAGAAATGVRPLGPAEARAVLGDRFAAAVTDPALLAELVPGQEVTGALAVAGGGRHALVYATGTAGGTPAAIAAGIEAATAHLADTVRGLRSEAAVLDALHSTGRQLTAQLDIDRIVQDATDAATKATGAEFGAFFYNLIDEFGESYTLYTLSGVPREAFAGFPMPRNTAVFAPTFDGDGTVRSPDITRDPRFGKNAPHHGMPEGHLPVCSYLAVPVISPTTEEVLGGFFFGHSRPDRFTARHEYLAESIAGYSAIALDNARLYERERTLASELSRSMLPVAPPTPGLDVVTRYLPAATGSKVGGDWFDVIALPSGATAFVIGDVVGHGVTAATVMGQVRTAIRCYALLGLPPSEVLRDVSALTGGLFGESFVTCFYAVHRPDEGTLTYANAGHLPAILIRPDAGPEQIGEALAQPLGVGAEFPQRTTAFPRGADLVLYTDGLVESRTRDLTLGVEWLLAGIPAVLAAADPGPAWDKLIDELTHGRHDDDIALIHVRHRGEDGA